MKKTLLPIFVSFFLITPSAFAQTLAPNSLPAPVITSLGGVITFICRAINWIFTFLVIGAVLAVIIAAFLYLTSAGDPKRTKSASGLIIFSAIAIAVALIAKGIPLAVASFFGGSIGTLGC